MTSRNLSVHDEKINSLAARYEQQGYEVFRTPSRTELPFDLGTYEPDLVARKAGGGLIVEVKTSAAKTSVERFQALAETIREHPGWRFLLVTPDDLNAAVYPHDMVGWNELLAKLEQSRALIASGGLEPAVLYLWAIFEASMRKLAIAAAIPIERLPATRLVNQLYTLGYLSVDDFATAKQFSTLRNQISHGFGSERDYSSLSPFFQLVNRSVEDWQREPAVDDSAEAT